MKKTSLALLIALVIISIVAACTQQAPQQNTPVKGNENLPDYTPANTGTVNLEGTQELKKFSSEKEIIQFLQNANSYSSSPGYGGVALMRNVAMDASESAGAPAPMAQSEKSSSSPTSSSHSGTNVQVEGVDEADFVKNDGKYVYIISQDNLVIVDGFPAADAKVVSKTKLEGRPRDMFVN